LLLFHISHNYAHVLLVDLSQPCFENLSKTI